MDAKEVQAALASPFEVAEVKFKPGIVRNDRALALAYVDARVVQDRLDDVLGIDGWQDEYTPLPDGSVMCRLQARIAGCWVTKTDVGSPSEQPDEHDRMKAAFSDALKRAAIKLGVGRYLYRVASQWCGYDPTKKQFTQLPRLPESARPGAVVHQGGQDRPAVAAPAQKQLAPADNLQLREEAIGAYAQCADVADWNRLNLDVKTDAEAGKFSRADILAIRQAAEQAQDRLAGAVA